ncbi:twin-arginine translocation signal domain-containing protein [Candidatus Zixiibacteriota bacterium]
MTTRRNFIQTTAITGGALSLGLAGCAKSDGERAGRARNPLKILILGGTSLIGPSQVEYALARGHTVTLFNRGRTNTHLFPEVEKLVGDRDNDIEALKGREWDVVLDNHPSIPRWVRMTAELLKDSVQQYVFVSSLSVYSDNSIIGMDENGPVATIDDPTIEQVTGATYGALKVLCEQEAERAFPGRATNIRPGLIVGPGDSSDRYTYWPVRIDRGGEVLAPGDPLDPVQIIDTRDLGEWMIHLVENSTYGLFNATGPEKPLPIGEMLGSIKEGIGSDATFTWVNADFLQEQRIRAWSDMPAWVPPRDGMEGFGRFDCSRAIAAGLTFRPHEITARDTLEWHKTRPEERQANLLSGISAEREAEVLEAWHSHGSE